MLLLDKVYIVDETKAIKDNMGFYPELEEWMELRERMDFLFWNYQTEMEEYNEERRKRMFNTEPSKEKRGRKKVKGHIYFLLYPGKGVKVGCSKNYKARVSQIQTACPDKLKLIGAVESDDIYKEEKEFHSFFDHHNKQGEWFKFDEEYVKEIFVNYYEGRKIVNDNR